jgi:hypothetical protein
MYSVPQLSCAGSSVKKFPELIRGRVRGAVANYETQPIAVIQNAVLNLQNYRYI